MPRAFPWGRGAHLEVVNGGGGAADQTRHWVRNVPSALLGAGGGTGDCPSPGVGAGCSSAASKGRLCRSLSSSMASERVFVPWYPCPCRVLRAFGDGSLPTFLQVPPLPHHCPFTHPSGNPITGEGPPPMTGEAGRVSTIRLPWGRGQASLSRSQEGLGDQPAWWPMSTVNQEPLPTGLFCLRRCSEACGGHWPAGVAPGPSCSPPPSFSVMYHLGYRCQAC